MHLIGEFPILEKQLVGWDPLTSRTSPDRLDALVHACRWLMEGERKRVRIATAGNRSLPGVTRNNAYDQAPYGSEYLPWG